MLNELFHLAGSLERIEVRLHSWHRHFKECPQGGKVFYVDLDADGHVVGARWIDDREARAGLRKYERAAGYSFPSFNIPPLLQFDGDADKERAAKFKRSFALKEPPTATEREEELKELANRGVSGWIKPDKGDRGKDEMDKLNDCHSTVARELKDSLGEPPQEARAFTELLRRAQRTTGSRLHGELKQYAFQRIEAGGDDSADWMDVLFFHTGKTPKKVAIVLELSDQSQFDYPANHPAVQRWVNDRLLALEESAQADKQQSAAKDAFAVTGGGMDESFPEVKMSVLGKVNLRAMSSESPCQRRYRVADSKSFPVSQPTRQSMKNALEWITRDERRGKMWCDVSTLGGSSAILVAYPSELPAEAPELAGLFGGTNDEPDSIDARFEACAKRVTQSLKGQVARSRNADLCVFVLTKPDGFRTKVLHSARYAIARLLETAENWQAGCKDLPPVFIRQFGAKKGDKPVWREPLTPFPAEVVWCLNTVWQRAGTHCEAVFDLDIADGLSLLLADGPILRTVATRAVRTATSNSLSLLLAIGQASHQGKVHAMGNIYGKQALLLPSILGLLLNKLGHTKGAYMKSPPFWVGRLLTVADQLHVQYCHGVRKGQIPPQLVGNALMTTAMETPERALALFWQRIKPYHAWAQTVQGGDEVRLAKYFLGELGRVSKELTEAELPNRCSDADKVAMLLGYLARSEKEKPDASQTANEGDK